MIADCQFHGERFNSLNHQPLVLNACEHTQCSQAFEEYLSRTGGYKCPTCKVAYFAARDVNEIATKRALQELEEAEVKCEVERGHRAGVVGHFLCKRDRKVYCEACKHTSDCCFLPESLSFEIAQLLREESKRSDLGDHLKYAISSLRTMPAAQARYDLLRKCVESEESGTWKCPFHCHFEALFLHKATLKFGCEECARGKGGFVDLRTNLDTCKDLINAFLERIDCQTVPFAVLRDLSRLSLLSRKSQFSLIQRISELPETHRVPIGATLICPSCLSAVFSLRRLPCFEAVHGICSTCLSPQLTKGFVRCPLDGKMYSEVSSELLKSPFGPLSQPYFFTSDTTDPRQYGSRTTEEARATVGFQGTELPQSSLPDCEVLRRFWAVYPPFEVKKNALRPWMLPWEVQCALGQVEALGLEVDTRITLKGVTIACPVDSHVRVTLKDMKITLGEGNTSTIISIQPSPIELFAGKPCQDVSFAPSVPISAHQKAVLSFQMASSEDRIQVYRGNHVTAPDKLQSAGVGQWRLFQPELTGAFLGGDQSKTGPILRLFYSLD